jgi:hypothetical protein
MSMSLRLCRRRRRAGLDLEDRCLDAELQVFNQFIYDHPLWEEL